MPTLAESLLDTGAQWGRGVQSRAATLASALKPSTWVDAINTLPDPRPPADYKPPVDTSQFADAAMALGMNMGPLGLGHLGGMIGQTVFHGSPHKFDKFDMSKIGTGEGAQAYGHGLYFAENPEVAKQYQKQLSDSYYAGKDGQLKQYGDAWTAAKDAVSPLVKHPDHAREVTLQMQNWVDAGKKPSDFLKNYDVSPELKPAYEAAAKTFDGLKKHQGQTYKVDLPDEHIAKMLDWDKPLSQQTIFKNVKDVAAEYKANGKPVDAYAKFISLINAHQNQTGGDFYNGMLSKFGGSQAEMSKFMREAGIPGIRYLDGGSRAGGKGTSNYVVFDDKLPKIVGRE